jgi:poly-gamma-glutamate synthesis protein (capsule biosynthesis protein)
MAETITLAAAGDICISGPVRDKIREQGTGWPFEKVLEALQADLVFANLECLAYRPGQPEPESRLRMCMEWTDGQGLRDAGFSVVSLANNHILDCGGDVALQTAEFCRRQGIAYAGFGASQAEARRGVIIERQSIKVGFLAYVEDFPVLKRQVGPGPAYLSEPNVLEDIDRLKEMGADTIPFGTSIARDGLKAKGGMAGSAGGRWWPSRGGVRPIQRSTEGHGGERVRRPAWC